MALAALTTVDRLKLIQHEERIFAMKNATTGFETSEDDVLAFEVADEALEIAAGTEKERANYTLGACSGLSVCPG